MIEPNPSTDQVLSILMDDAPLAQERLLNALRRRADRVISITTTRERESDAVWVTVVVPGARSVAEAVGRHLAKLVEVREVAVLAPGDFVGLQLALVSVYASGSAQDEASDILSQVGARLLKITPTELCAQLTDCPETVDVVVRSLERIGKTRALRAGLVAFAGA